jgi:anti-sigma factor RsiW
MMLSLEGLIPSPGEQQALEAHLRACPACQAEYALLQRAQALFGEAAREPAPLALADRVMARVHRRARWLAYLRGGALLALGMVIMAALWAVPAAGLMGVAANNPSAFHAILGAVVRLANLVSMLGGALWLILRAALSSGGGLLCIAAALFAGALTVQWVRLVGRSSRLSVK